MRRSIVWNAPAVQCSLGIEARWSLFLVVLPLDINVLPPAIAWHSGDTASADGDWRLSHSTVMLNKSITSETLFELCETYRHRFFEYGVHFHQVFCSAHAATSVVAL